MSNRLYIGVDLQVGFLNDELKQSGYVERVEQYLQSLPTDSVVLTRYLNHPGSPFERFLGWSEMQPDDPQTRLIGTLEEGNYRVIDKAMYTAWVPVIIETANALHADEIVIFGLDTDACVLKTALDVFEAGLCPIVLSDMCGSGGGHTRHEMGLDVLRILIDQKHVIQSDQLH